MAASGSAPRAAAACAASKTAPRPISRSWKDLEDRIEAANPRRIFIVGEAWLHHLEEAASRVAVWSLRAVRHLGTDRCADAAAWLARRIGPRLRGHRTARSQLTAAFPEKSAAEIEAILRGMWDNLARATIEYAALDRLWDHEPGRSGGRIEVDAASESVWSGVLADRRPALGFAAHLANWELARRRDVGAWPPRPRYQCACRRPVRSPTN